MLQKIIRHARSGTLFRVVRTKVRHVVKGNRGAGDTYYGDKAAAYEAERIGQKYWDDQQRIAEELFRELPDGLEVLDVPFGTGRFMEVFAEKSFRVHGVEISAEMVAAARQARPQLMDGVDVHIGTATDLPHDDGAFDLVCSFRFLSEIVESAEAIEAMKEFRRVCRGRAFLDLGYRDETAPTVRPPRPKDRLGVALTEKAVRELLTDVGFEVERVVHCYESDDGHRAVFICRAV